MNKTYSKKKLVGHVLVDLLIKLGVKYVFTVPGESFLPVIDGFYGKEKKIKLVVCRHEAAATNMAESYGKITGQPGVCFVTRGPGASHASIGIHTAMQDSTPLVLFIGQVERSSKGKEAFQEVDYFKMFCPPFTKGVRELNNPKMVYKTVYEAFFTAKSGRMGPVIVSLPEDVLSNKIVIKKHNIVKIKPIKPSVSKIKQLVKILNDSLNPIVILGGSGWNLKSKKGLANFLKINNLPTCVSFRRQHLLDNNSENYIGDLSTSSDPSLIKKVKNADVILSIGARLGEITTQGYTTINPKNMKQKLIHIYPDNNEFGKVFDANLSIHSSIEEFCSCIKNIKLHGRKKWEKWVQKTKICYENYNSPPDYPNQLDLGKVIIHLRNIMPKDTILTIDAGNFSGWIQRFWKFGSDNLEIAPTSGAMGYAIPAGIAAKIIHPNREVLICVGDGGFGMSGQEIATAKLYGASPIILLFNNNMFGTIRMHQELKYPDRKIATELFNPNFTDLAKAYNIHGERVDNIESFPAALERCLLSKTISLIELMVDPKQLNTKMRI